MLIASVGRWAARRLAWCSPGLAKPGGCCAGPDTLAELNRITLILIATFLVRGVFYLHQNYALATPASASWWTCGREVSATCTT